jgi:hypothetical protein
VAVLLACLIVVPTTLANMQSICARWTGAALARAIAGGDLTSRSRNRGQGRTDAPDRGAGGMQASLARIVGEVRQSTE